MQPQSSQQQKQQATQQDLLLRAQESRRDFPSANYNESEPADSVKRAIRKEKQKRYNTFDFVYENPPMDIAERSIALERPDLPAVPMTESDIVIIGDVEGAEAHLSEHKQNVFSEFTVRIKEVLKSPTALLRDSLITIDRDGGFVNYPNGHKVLYSFRGEKMPRIGAHYVFFLKHDGQDLKILTAYELGESGVSPLDEFPQFLELKGQDEAVFLSALREPQKPTPSQAINVSPS